MILLKPYNYLLNSSSLKSNFIYMCDLELAEMRKSNLKGLNQILDIYDISDIKRAYNSVYVDFKGNLLIPEQTTQSQILRLLELSMVLEVAHFVQWCKII